MTTKIDLKTLYALWDDFSAISVRTNGIIDSPFQHFPAGAPVEEIWNWFEAQNSRFCIDDIVNDLRLEPLTACADYAYVVDTSGQQVCVGDEIHATINVGPYGQMAKVVCHVQKAHSPDGLLDALRLKGALQERDRPAVIAVTPVDKKHVRLGRSFSDVEHGFEEKATITRFSKAKPLLGLGLECNRPRQGVSTS